MYIYTPLCRYWIALYRYILVLIVAHVDIEQEDNKQFISNIPRNLDHNNLYNGVEVYYLKGVIGLPIVISFRDRWYIHIFFFGNGLIDDVIVIGWTDSDLKISRALIYTYTHIHTHTYTYTYILTHKHIYIYTHTYIHIFIAVKILSKLNKCIYGQDKLWCVTMILVNLVGPGINGRLNVFTALPGPSSPYHVHIKNRQRYNTVITLEKRSM